MKVECAWCKKDLGSKEPLEDRSVSHGICPECYAREARGISPTINKEDGHGSDGRADAGDVVPDPGDGGVGGAGKKDQGTSAVKEGRSCPSL
jgi:hypothetical protein